MCLTPLPLLAMRSLFRSHNRGQPVLESPGAFSQCDCSQPQKSQLWRQGSGTRNAFISTHATELCEAPTMCWGPVLDPEDAGVDKRQPLPSGPTLIGHIPGRRKSPL